MNTFIHTKPSFSYAVHSGKRLTLADCTSLSDYAQIFVPSTINVNQAIDNSDMVNLVKTELSKRFGGTSTYDYVEGSWYSDDLASLVEEGVKIVHSWASKLSEDDISFVISLAKFVKVEMSQESVLFVLCRTKIDASGEEKQIVKAYLI